MGSNKQHTYKHKRSADNRQHYSDIPDFSRDD